MPSGIKNPYLTAFKKLSNEHKQDYNVRFNMVRKYAWSIPTQQFAEKIAAVGITHIVEIGAGTGYWAWFLSQFGLDVVAYDIHPHYNKFAKNVHYPVEVGHPIEARCYPDRALMLVWPLHSTNMASSTLQYYKGKWVIYVGEGKGGCTGDTPFHEALEREWQLVDDCECPNWDVGFLNRVHSHQFIYQRKEKS